MRNILHPNYSILNEGSLSFSADPNYFVPTGQTILKEKDKILIITDNHEALIKTYRNLGIENV